MAQPAITLKLGSLELQHLVAGIGGEILARLGPVEDCSEPTRIGASASVKIEVSAS